MPGRFANALGGSFDLADGYDIPKIGFGSCLIMDQESVTNVVRAALKSGYRLFDTAHIYANFTHEKHLGEAFKTVLPELGLTREDIFITTKTALVNEDPLANVEKQIKRSLEHLQTPYLDLVLIHYPRDRFTGTDDDERNESNRKIVWQKLEEFQASGAIRSIGVSNYMIYHLVELFEYAKKKPVLNQCEYTPYLNRKLLRRFCKKHNIVFQAFSSLCTNNKEVLVEKPITEAAAKYGVTPQTVLYAFAYRSGAGLLPNSSSPARIESNIKDTLKTELTPDEVKAIQALDKNLVCSDCTPEDCI